MEFIGIVFIAGVYFLPTIAGWNKKHADGIVVLNVTLGWTGLGWIGALIWAVSSPYSENYNNRRHARLMNKAIKIGKVIKKIP